MSDPARVLFVCTANICRSAYAEVYARALIEREALAAEVRSAGVYAQPGQPMDPPMATQLAERGIEAGNFRSSLVERDTVEWAEVVLTATQSHRGFLIEEFPRAIGKVFTLGQFARRLDEVPEDATAGSLIAALGRRRRMARRGDDINDPFRRGDEAAAEAAQRLGSMVDLVLPRLARGRS